MRGLPSGMVTFLFTDVEGSTRMHQRLADRYAVVLDRQLAILRDAVDPHGGVVLNTMGDGMFAAFGSADDAVDGCLAGQRALLAHDWPPDAVVRVRMGLHSGQAAPNSTDGYTSIAVHQA